jgi:ubiquinol-cytochrome c reductase subunit 8
MINELTVQCCSLRTPIAGSNTPPIAPPPTSTHLHNGWRRLRSSRANQGYVRPRSSSTRTPPTCAQRPHLSRTARTAAPASQKILRLTRSDYRWHIGGWGNPYEGGGRPGKGVVTYALSPNRQRPMATFIGKGFWNVMRRSRNQVLYTIPPFIVAYGLMQWAIEK